MKRSTLLWALAILNAALLVGLSYKLGLEKPAYAQARARGDYVMIPAHIPGANSGVLYLLDTRNGQLSAFLYDHNKREFNVMPPIDISRLLEGVGVGGGGRVPPR